MEDGYKKFVMSSAGNGGGCLHRPPLLYFLKREDCEPLCTLMDSLGLYKEST